MFHSNRNNFSNVKTINHLPQNDNDKFREEPLSKLSLRNIGNITNGLEKLLQICIGVLDKLARQNTLDVIYLS